MIRFLFKGLLRDKSRSRLPIMVVAIGVTLSVFLHAYVTGVMGDMIELSARFSNGHVKIMSKAYAENESQLPNDLALLGAENIIATLNDTFPNVYWANRIKFGGLIDVPDSSGETKSQGAALGIGIDLFSPQSREIKMMNLEKSLVQGKIPSKEGEILLSDDFANKLEVSPGEKITLISTTMNGAMAFYNFKISGTLKFGNTAMDRGTIIADINDVQHALDMQDAAGEILGFFPSGFYDNEKALQVVTKFRKIFFEDSDEYAPVIVSLKENESMGMYIDLAKYMGAIITAVFMIAMSIVLWNAGLLGGLRRYGEVGIRLAIGEEKRHIYGTMLYESIIIGIVGTAIGTGAGLFFAWLLQEYGFDISEFNKNATTGVMIPNEIRARITQVDYFIGFIPGVISTLIGTALAGIGIYKRQTANLFKELEV